MKLRRSNRSAYTLIELMVVVTLLALLTGGVTVQLTPSIRKARNEQAIDAIQFLERQTRDACRRNRHRGNLKYSIANQMLTAEIDGTKLRTLKLPASLSLSSVLTANGNSPDRQTDIFIGPTGETESYALSFTAKSNNRTLLIAGVTGKTIPMETEDEAMLVLSQLSP